MPTRIVLVGCFALLVLACEPKGGDDESKDEPGSYACLVCANPQGFSEEDWADEAECRGSGAAYNPDSSCLIDGERLQVLSLNFHDCERKPACVGDESLLGMGGSLFGDFDYKCEICDGEGAVDQAFDGGSEDSGCTSGSIVYQQGMECPSGQKADLVLLSDCEQTPACVE